MKIRDLDLSQSPLNAEHEALGLPPVEDYVSHPDNHPVLRAAMWAAVLILFSLIGFLAWRLFFGDNGGHSGLEIIESALSSPTFWSAVAVGFLAQVVDGALGMAYGITATTFLLSAGASPAAASASVHIAEVFTTGLSGISHVKLGNVNKSLFLRLLLPGIIGAVLGRTLQTIMGKGRERTRLRIGRKAVENIRHSHKAPSSFSMKSVRAFSSQGSAVP